MVLLEKFCQTRVLPLSAVPFPLARLLGDARAWRKGGGWRMACDGAWHAQVVAAASYPEVRSFIQDEVT